MGRVGWWGGVVAMHAVLAVAAAEPCDATQVPHFSNPFNPWGIVNVGFESSPELVDIDADGDLDAFVGDFDGHTNFFRNVGTAEVPAFTPIGADAFGMTYVGNTATPAFSDLDADGDLDALVGNAVGDLYFFENVGTADAPAFLPWVLNPFGLSRVEYEAAPTFADLDADGDDDALVGDGAGTLHYFENVGAADAPAFAPAIPNPFSLVSVDGWSRPRLVDLDADGDFDAVIGDFYGTLRVFANVGTPETPTFGPPIVAGYGLGGVGGVATPAFGDLDGDGDLDALIGHDYGNVFFYENAGTATAPLFASPPANTFGLPKAGFFSQPVFGDLDGDGDLDALVGRQYSGIIFHRNVGTPAAASFAAGVNNLFSPTGLDEYMAPTLVDVDADGDLDVFVGTAHGPVFFFRNVGTVASPSFATAVANPFGLTTVGTYTNPTFADLDADGDQDALIGVVAGDVVLFANVGTPSAPAFAAPVTNPFGATDVPFDNAPTLVDVDGDGDRDLLVGTGDGPIVLMANVGTPEAPAFAAPLQNPFGLDDVGRNTTITLADLDADGDLDAVLGDRSGRIVYFANDPASVPTPSATPTEVLRSTPTPTATLRTAATATTTPTAARTATPSPTPTFVPGACSEAPRDDCRTATRGSFTIAKHSDPSRDRSSFEWKHGLASSADLGRPEIETAYALCVYDDASVLALRAVAEGGAVCGGLPCWNRTATKARYQNRPPYDPDGVKQILMKSAPEGVARAAFRFTLQGDHVDAVTLPFPTGDVVVQIVNGDGLCFESRFGTGDVVVNDARRFKTKRP